MLLYGSGSEALTRARATTGAALREPAPGQAEKVAMLGSFGPYTRNGYRAWSGRCAKSGQRLTPVGAGRGQMADPYQQTPAGIALSDRTEDEVEQRVTFADNAGLSG